MLKQMTRKWLATMLVMMLWISLGEAAADDDDSSADFAYEVVQLVNQERAKVGAGPLRMAADLQEAADIRARELTQAFSHTRPDGSSCFTVLKNSKYRRIGENIAAGQRSPAEVMDSWMHSKGHRENILNPEFREIGVGYYSGESDTECEAYWVQLFRL